LLLFCCDFNETDRLKYLYAQSCHGLCGIISLSLQWHSIVKLKKEEKKLSDNKKKNKWKWRKLLETIIIAWWYINIMFCRVLKPSMCFSQLNVKLWIRKPSKLFNFATSTSYLLVSIGTKCMNQNLLQTMSAMTTEMYQWKCLTLKNFRTFFSYSVSMDYASLVLTFNGLHHFSFCPRSSQHMCLNYRDPMNWIEREKKVFFAIQLYGFSIIFWMYLWRNFAEVFSW